MHELPGAVRRQQTSLATAGLCGWCPKAGLQAGIGSCSDMQCDSGVRSADQFGTVCAMLKAAETTCHWHA